MARPSVSCRCLNPKLIMITYFSWKDFRHFVLSQDDSKQCARVVTKTIRNFFDVSRTTQEYRFFSYHHFAKTKGITGVVGGGCSNGVLYAPINWNISMHYYRDDIRNFDRFSTIINTSRPIRYRQLKDIIVRIEKNWVIAPYNKNHNS